MPNPLIECIPNYSEARRPEVVEAIIQSIKAVDGVTILDRHSDLDHNRTVITFVGSPAAVEEAAFQSIATAGKLIDLNHHTGEHPRLGAADVVPFVPIRDVTMQECIEIARRLGKRVGEELQIPVYLYEEAASRPERRNLEDVRRGEFEALKKEIGVRPERDPDFGPAVAGPAGAVIIGARQPLIAFNVNLNTTDVSIAQKIARAVRNSSGGLRYVKGLGLLVDGRAQVSMNLTNYRATPIARVVEFIRREAARYGTGIHNCELVGLVPQEALVDAAVWYTQLDLFDPQEQVLETRLAAALAESQEETPQPLEASFIEEVAKGTPAPGGGSSAAHTGALAAALVSMVARLTVGKKKYAAVEARMWEIIEQAEALRAKLTAAVSEDGAAFEKYLAAVRMPKDTPDQQAQRAQALEEATRVTIEVPLEASRKALTVMRLAVEVAQTGNVNAISDAAVGAGLAHAALTGSGLNVRINCPNLQDQEAARRYVEAVREIEDQARELDDQLRKALDERGNLA
ncbi:MAG: glutamate formimidoyltransferase [Chloroflexi bacterium]|nr:glutamate formimidoyltransferase [Chloroflexota bacterium]